VDIDVVAAEEHVDAGLSAGRYDECLSVRDRRLAQRLTVLDLVESQGNGRPVAVIQVTEGRRRWTLALGSLERPDGEEDGEEDQTKRDYPGRACREPAAVSGGGERASH
jgi:hypothetical protein